MLFFLSHVFYCCYRSLPLCWAFAFLESFPFFPSSIFFSSLFYNFNFLTYYIFYTFILLFAFPTVLFPLWLIFNIYKSSSSTSKWQPTPVFLPGESQGWRSLVGCHLWGPKESDTTEELSSSSIYLYLTFHIYSFFLSFPLNILVSFVFIASFPTWHPALILFSTLCFS